jgi:CDP-paratose 2-epimerase
MLEKYTFDDFGPFDAIIHCAAQPSHDKAKDIPIIDFEVNALGTLNLLELTRKKSPDAVFIFTSTNKVYGDAPNEIPMVELEKRFEYALEENYNGVKENFRIDQSVHSIFGASKVAADVMVQEYGRYFGLKTCVLRGGCLTGPSHSGVELHGFLSYLVKCVVNENPYKIFGYKGKQVRDNIHSFDVISAMEEIIKNPIPGSVYNIGGGRENSISMLEAIEKAEKISGKKLNWTYDDTNRVGDHICYISDLSKFKKDYPNWKITKSIDRIFIELIGSTIKGITERYMPGDGGDNYFSSYADTLSSLATGKTLDIGCGQGYLTEMLAKNPNVTSVLGTDLYSGYQIENPKINYMVLNTMDLLNSEEKYDTILSTEHIEHLHGDRHVELLEWIKKSLNLGGKFLGSMPFPDDVKNPNPWHFKTYTMGDWEIVLNSVFPNVKIWQCHPWAYSWEVSM